MHYFQVPRESLLNKNGDVNAKGEYQSPFKDPRKRFGASLGNLSSGRVGIINMANMNLHLAVIIAVRYSAVRKQFGPQNHQVFITFLSNYFFIIFWLLRFRVRVKKTVLSRCQSQTGLAELS